MTEYSINVQELNSNFNYHMSLLKLTYFCKCDIGVHVISCLGNYIMTVTNASLVCTCRRSLSIDCLPTAIIINLLVFFLAQDILKLCIT